MSARSRITGHPLGCTIEDGCICPEQQVRRTSSPTGTVHVLRPFDWKKGPQSGNTMCGKDIPNRRQVTSSPVHSNCDDCHIECYRAARGWTPDQPTPEPEEQP